MNPSCEDDHGNYNEGNSVGHDRGGWWEARMSNSEFEFCDI
jgi:hypothetical protein